MKTRHSVFALLLLSFFFQSAEAQLTAPFAGGVKLQQGGGTNPGFGLSMKAKQTFSGDVTLNWVQPTANGILKVTGFGAGAGDLSVTALDLTTDVGSSILPILNGGTGASTANGALNNLLPSQSGNNGKFLKTDGTNSSWQTAVTSVGLALPAELTVSNSPVTSTGTLTAAWASQTANKVFASPDGASGTPSFRSLVSADIPNLDASKITTGILPIARGGTNSGTALNGDRIMVSSGGAIVESAALTNGQLLIGSTGVAPVAANLTAGNGITITNGAGQITIAANSNGTNKTRVNLSATAYSYTGNAPAAGFTLSATSVINITILEAGSFPITATVTNINTVNNTYDFVISGYPTAGSIALVTFQN
jgi:hypothetical protein